MGQSSKTLVRKRQVSNRRGNLTLDLIPGLTPDLSLDLTLELTLE